jgi:hypothetical protein
MKITKEFLSLIIKEEINETAMGMGMPAPISVGPSVPIDMGPEASAESEIDSLLSELQALLDAWTERNPDTPAGRYYHELSSVYDKYGGGGCGGPPMQESKNNNNPSRRNKND